MGKQIRFFMNHEDEKKFLEFIYSNRDILVKRELKNGKVQIARSIEELTDYKYYIFNQSWKMVSDKFSEVDDEFAEVIEYYRTYIVNIKDNKIMVKPGSFGIEKKYLVSKDIDKIMPGRFWVQMKYWSKEDDKDIIITKNPELDKKYKLYKKYITKNFRLSKSKYWYIGPGAYELYKQGWKMMSGGPIGETEFD